MNRRCPARLPVISLLFTLLGACTPEAAPPVIAARPVKVERIEAIDTQSSDTFVGTLRALQRAELGFEAGGRIAAISVDVGDRVQAGQVLARLDTSVAQQQLTRAEADEAAAIAAFAERDAQLARVQDLEREQIVAGAQVEGVKAQREAALGQRLAAGAALALARRTLALAEIRAPYTGQIVARMAQPHGDVAPGQAVLNIEAPGALEVIVALPEAVAARLKPGDRGRIVAAGTNHPVRLDKLSARADNGAQVQAIFRLDGTPARLISGLSVAVELPGPARATLALPASALLPGAQSGEGQVFVLNDERQRVELRRVRYSTTLAGDGRIALEDGVSAGESVVVAGTPFLTDGQAATRFVASTRMPGATQ